MYFSQVRIDPNDPDVVYHRRRRPAHVDSTAARRSTPTSPQPIHDDVHAIWIDPANSNHVIIGNDGGLAVSLGPGEDLELRSQPAGRPLLPRELRHGDAVQRLRRHAGQLRLVRPERGARRRRHRQLRLDDDAGRRRLRRAAGSDRLPHRLQRVAGRQHGPHRSRHRRDDVDPPAGARPASRRCAGTGTRRSCMSPHDPKIVYAAAQQGVPLGRPRADSWTPISPDLTTQRQPRRHRDDGREGQRHHASRRTTASWRGRRSSRSPSRRRRPACSTPAPTTATLQVSRDGGKTWTNVIDKMPGRAEGHVRVGGRAVAVRRGHGLRDVRRPPPERLRDLHLREQRLRPDVAVGRRQPEGRGRQDADRGPEEPGRALPRHRDRPVRVDRSRRRAGRASRRTCRRCASTRSRCIRATTR